MGNTTITCIQLITEKAWDFVLGVGMKITDHDMAERLQHLLGSALRQAWECTVAC